jgi:mannosyltransferase OCH1-like enzyme
VSIGWRYHFLTDADALRFLRDVDPTQGDADKFSTIRPGAIQADFLRVVWLLAFGGFYIDQVCEVVHAA